MRQFGAIYDCTAPGKGIQHEYCVLGFPEPPIVKFYDFKAGDMTFNRQGLKLRSTESLTTIYGCIRKFPLISKRIDCA